MAKDSGNSSRMRAARVPEVVRLLTSAQARKVAEEAFPEQDFTDEEISDLKAEINGNLEMLRPSLDASKMSDLDDIRDLLRQAHKRLGRPNQQLLNELGSVYYDLHRSETPGTPWLKASSAVETFVKSYDEIVRWLADQRTVRVVAHRQKPILNTQLLAGHFLPKVFENCFMKKFGNGRAGPGLRFGTAVLREAGIRTDDEGTVIEYIIAARRRLMAPSPKVEKVAKSGGPKSQGDNAKT